ncbi:MAG: hypothetical protein CM15mV127_290 [Caudoviricetes sp.]|nr:MAG: hypothetical protein CM15mV127_290 [Caudoviricetes sp.]
MINMIGNMAEWRVGLALGANEDMKKKIKELMDKGLIEN